MPRMLIGTVCRGVLLVAALSTLACGGGGSGNPVTPTPPVATPPPTTPPPTPTPTYAFAVSGRVVASGTGAPVAGATLTFADGQPTQSAPDGTFRYTSPTNPASTPYAVQVTAPGHVERALWLNWQRERTDVRLDLLPLAAPFSIDFYRQLVRNDLERREELEVLRRLTRSPSFYIRTVDNMGRDVDPATIVAITATLRTAVPAFTGGVLGVAAVETGRDNPDRLDWITIEFVEDPRSQTCGTAFIAANPGRILFNLNRCGGCPGTRIRPATVVHEVGHALGFWHVSGREHVMEPFEDSPCTQTAPSAVEQFHAAIAYTRAPGNVDPDTDPRSNAAMLMTESEPMVISCIRRR